LFGAAAIRILRIGSLEFGAKKGLGAKFSFLTFPFYLIVVH
jgi:hypothetical protein